MANVNEKFDNLTDAKRRVLDLLDDETVTLKKLDLRSVQGGYKLIATTYPGEEA